MRTKKALDEKGIWVRYFKGNEWCKVPGCDHTSAFEVKMRQKLGKYRQTMTDLGAGFCEFDGRGNSYDRVVPGHQGETICVQCSESNFNVPSSTRITRLHRWLSSTGSP